MGTGTAEDSANGLILANTAGESSPTNTRGTAKYLLALNGGSNSISVFRNAPQDSSSWRLKNPEARDRSASP
jgi:hypothetical protein